MDKIVNIIDFDDSNEFLVPFVNAGADAIFYYTYSDGYAGTNGEIKFINEKPVIGARFSLWEEQYNPPMMGVKDLIASLENMPKDPKISDG